MVEKVSSEIIPILFLYKKTIFFKYTLNSRHEQLSAFHFLTVSIVFSVDKQNFTSLYKQNFKTKTGMKTKISVFVICVKATLCLLLYNLHDCAFNGFLEISKLSIH